MSKVQSPVAAEMPSEDSCSTDGEFPDDECSKLLEMFKNTSAKQINIDSKVGLNGGQTNWSFPCMNDEASKRFYVWLGDLNIDKFTKSTLLNLVDFAEKAGCNKLFLVIDRDHPQKDQFQKVFKVVDAQRVSKRGMEELMTAEKLQEWIENYAVYRLELA